VKKPMWAGLLLIWLLPNLAMAQSSFDGTWKIDVGTLPMSTDALVWLLQDGMYHCKSCTPPVDVKADGQDQPAPRRNTTRLALGS
jgi:hypothetical protein